MKSTIRLFLTTVKKTVFSTLYVVGVVRSLLQKYQEHFNHVCAVVDMAKKSGRFRFSWDVIDLDVLRVFVQLLE